MSMRPLHLTFTPAAASTNGLAAGLTGAGPWAAANFTLLAPSDGLAHTINLTSAANLSGINITVTGTDADGVALSETRAGPNANTVATTAYFKTVTGISAASTLGANTMDTGWAATFVSQTIPLEIYEQVATTCHVEATGTVGFDIEGTGSNIRASAAALQSSFSWLNDANFTAKTASLAAALAVNWRAIRLVGNSYTAPATLILDVITGK